jgi:Ice-binding-like
MNRQSWPLIARLGLFVLIAATPAAAQTNPSLGTAGAYAVLGASTVTNTGPTVLFGDLGVSPGAAITGFPPGQVTQFTHAADADALGAQNAVTTAYNELSSQPCTGNLTGQDLGGLTLTPGVYCFDTSAQLTGVLTLNAQGNSAAVFIFKTGSTLTTAAASRVQIINDGGGICGPFWRIGSSATLGTTTSFIGNILALASITLTTGATVQGRALARTAAVTLDTNQVTPTFCSGVSSGPTPVPLMPNVFIALLAAAMAAAGYLRLRQHARV